MSKATSNRVTPWVELLPVFSSLLFHALVYPRWMLCFPAAGALFVARARGVSLSYSPLRLFVWAAVGATAGIFLNSIWPVFSPLPAMMMGPLCGTLVGLATYCAIAQRQKYATTYSMLLSALSTATPGSFSVYAGLAGLALSLGATAFSRIGLKRAGWVAAWGFLGFTVASAGAAFGLWHSVRAGGSALAEAILQSAQRTSDFSAGPLSNQIAVDRQSLAQNSDRLLMEVDGDAPQRLRTRVYDTFDGFVWRTSAELEAVRLKLGAPAAAELLRSTEVTLLQPLAHHLPVPAGVRAMEGVTPEVVGGWVFRGSARSGIPFSLRRSPQEVLDPEAESGNALTALPKSLRTELRPFALEFTRGATTADEQALALETWFRTRHQYSLSTDLSGPGSPLAVLIRDRRPASCAYFASAMAALLRSLDVPARVVSGYALQERNPFSGSILVRERDAHAWVEVYSKDQGRFVAFDPTPWKSRDAVFLSDATGNLAWFFQAASSQFRQRSTQAVDASLRVFNVAATSPLAWAVEAFGTGALIFVLYSRRRGARSKRWRVPKHEASRELESAYARYLSALERGAGIVPGLADTDDDILNRLRSLQYNQSSLIAEAFVVRYRQIRYGSVRAVASTDALIENLRQTLAQESSSKSRATSRPTVNPDSPS